MGRSVISMLKISEPIIIKRRQTNKEVKMRKQKGMESVGWNTRILQGKVDDACGCLLAEQCSKTEGDVSHLSG